MSAADTDQAPRAPKPSTPSKSETTLLEPFPSLALDAISVPSTAEEFAAALAAIKSAKVVGFDTESKPTFAKGEVSTGPHIVPLASRGRVKNRCIPEKSNPTKPQQPRGVPQKWWSGATA